MKKSIYLIYSVLYRNYLSFKSLFKISIIPNLVDPIFYLLIIGFGIGTYIKEINGENYLIFVTTGLIISTGMFSATAEATINAFIQYKIEKTYSAILITPVNEKELVIGHIIWAGIRSVIFGSLFMSITLLFIPIYNLKLLIVPILLFFNGILFGGLGLSFTYLSPSREFLNYYNILIIKPIFMLSNIIFPIDKLPIILQKISYISPLYHSVNIIRWIYRLKNTNIITSVLILNIFIIIFILKQIYILKKKKKKKKKKELLLIKSEIILNF
ncbi:ABC transporter permease [Oceanivirga salmonicida]|uniref:ABC transporter permease n=1 Tax=Oceanivirga salmonicida TaxID=1769291 RepID=UPI0012E129FC|nr:ABC transporter permease [Oceanivirga salmonicida]